MNKNELGMINKEKLKTLIGIFVGSIIGAFIAMFTPPFVWLIIIVILSLTFVINWDKLNKKDDERDTEEEEQVMKKYTITLSEKQFFLIINCLEDLHRFVCGNTSLSLTDGDVNFNKDVRKKLQELRPIINTELPQGLEYDWAGNGCKDKRKRKFIAMTYYLYREMLHQMALANNWNNVYSSPTLRCEDSGDVIKITFKE